MDRMLLSDPAVAGLLNEKFTAVRLDVNSREGKAFLERRALNAISPVVLVYEKGGRELDRHRGVPTTRDFLAFLNDTIRGDHFAAIEKRAMTEPGYLDDYDHLARFGRRLHERRDARARDILERAMGMDPKGEKKDAASVRYQFADVAPEGERMDALAAFVREYPECSHAIRVHRLLAMIFESRKQAAEAIASYAYLLDHDALPGPWHRAAYARLLAFSGTRVDLALDLITAALRTDLKNARYHDTRAECLSRLGRYDEAIEEEIVAVERATQLAECAEYRRALYELRKRKQEQAR